MAVGGLLGVATLLALPLALAWACVPGAAIGFDRAVYEYRAGETVTVLGRAFAPATQVALTLQPPSGPSTTVGTGVITDNAGYFRDSFTLPASVAPGAYVVVAAVSTTDVDGHGRTYEAREAFRIMPPPVTTPPPGPKPPPPTVQRPMLAPAAGMVFTGTAGGDTIVGTQFADVIACGGGDDTVRGRGGNDVIKCGSGDDRIDGGAGNDRISGGPGRDRFSGEKGDDKLSGGTGKDTLKGDSGDDTLRGNAGKDKLFGGPGRDLLFRGAGDVLSGGPGKDRMVR